MTRTTYALLVLLITVLMGSSFAVGKVTLAYYSPLLLVGLRFIMAGLVLALWVGRRHLPRTGRDWARVLVIGSLQTTGVMGCSFLSLQTIPAGQTSILTFTSPLLVIVLGSWMLGQRYRWSQWLGVLIGCVGLIVVIGMRIDLEIGVLWGLGSAVFWALSTVLVKRWSGSLHTWTLSAYQMLFGGLLILAIALAVEPAQGLLRATFTLPAIALLVYLAVIGSSVQFATWFYLLDRGDPGKTSAFLFLVPVFGLLSGWLLLGETVQWYVYAGGALVLAGIFLVNWSPEAPAAEPKRMAAP